MTAPADRPLHVALGVLCGTTGGPATYGLRLAAALAERGDLRVTVVTDAEAGVAGCEVLRVPSRGGLDRLRWQWWALPRALSRLDCDLYHDTKNALPFGLRVPAVVTVHDLAYYRCPESFGRWSRAFLRRATADAVRRAARIVVPSQATADDLAQIYPRARQKIHVALHGIDPPAAVDRAQAAAVCARYGVKTPFVLHVGTVQARKNVDLLVAAVRAVRARGLPHRCVLIGRRGWLAERAMAEIERDDTAIWLGEVSDDDLAAFYATAAAFVSPSAYEGFGFTVADALAAGVPTIVSRAGSLPEVTGDAAVQLPELSVTAIAEALEQLLGDPARCAALRARGPERAAGFRWQDAAAATAAAYFEACSATSSSSAQRA